MLDEATAEDLRRHWDEGWNAGDLATIMAPFAPGVVFSSPFVARLTGDQARTTIDGYDALRAYVDHALRRAPGIRYTLEESYAGTDTLVLVYRCLAPDGTVGVAPTRCASGRTARSSSGAATTPATPDPGRKKPRRERGV